MKRFWWPLLPFWTYTPWGWCCAVVWNFCELTHVRLPYPHVVFGIIVGRKPVL